jgi:hypothetical protein
VARPWGSVLSHNLTSGWYRRGSGGQRIEPHFLVEQPVEGIAALGESAMDADFWHHRFVVNAEGTEQRVSMRGY